MVVLAVLYPAIWVFQKWETWSQHPDEAQMYGDN
jgi:hypothetical protein